MDRKMALLALIKEQKDILFGRFPTNITNELKIMAWKSITEKASEMGLFSKDWKFLRDITWQNWKKKSLRKREHVSGRSRIDESDELIFELTGVNLLIVEGEQSAPSASDESVNVDDPNMKDASSETPHQLNEFMKHNTPKKRQNPNDEDIQVLKKQRIIKQNRLLDLQSELKKQEIEKVQLEIYELKTKLKLPYCDKVEYLESIGDEAEIQVDPSDGLDDLRNNSGNSSSSSIFSCHGTS